MATFYLGTSNVCFMVIFSHFRLYFSNSYCAFCNGVNGVHLKYLRYADDILFISDNKKKIEGILDGLDREASKAVTKT